MRARRTPWWSFVLAAALGVLAGMGLAKYGEISGLPLVGAPWIVPVVLAVLGGVVLYMALQIHKYTTKNPVKRAQLKPLDPQKAFGTLVACKALGLAGAALAGWYGGQIIMSLPHGEAEFYSQAIIECVVACVVCVADMIVGIVGESGCGKTTVAKLLTGALRPDSGRVLLDGKPVESLDREAYYASLAHVSCETFLFHDTIRANFLLANPHATEEEMWRALALVRLDGLVRERGGLDFVLNEDAADISGGQKQRLALAVNLTAPKRIYIFDEATGNIDAESEGIIMEVIRSLSTFAGVTVITHRLANVAAADSILYMEDGRICEQGDHASLMARGGRYAALFCAQRELEQGYLELIKEAQA